MPTKRESWFCNYCHYEYDTEKAALECENGHALVAKTKAVFVDGRRYPSQVKVSLVDGVVMQFSNGTVIGTEGVME